MKKISFENKLILLLFFIVMITSFWVNNIYILFVFSVVSIFILYTQKWDKTALYILIFSLLYGLMACFNNAINSIFVKICYFFVPIIFYHFGNLCMKIYTTEKERLLFLLLTITLYLSNLFVNTCKDIAIVGIVNETRVLLNESNENSWAATLYGLAASIGIGCISSIFIKSKEKLLKFSYIVISLFSLISVIHLINRTGIIVCIGCIIFSLYITLKNEKSNAFYGILIIVAIISITISNFDFLGQDVLTAYNERENSDLNISNAGGRTAKWTEAMGLLFTSPLGWKNLGHAHNLWLDIARVGGLIAFIPFLMATFVYCKNLLWLIRKKNICSFDLIIITINFSMLLSSCVEPVIEGSLLFFCMLMMVWGITTYIVNEKKYLRKNNNIIVTKNNVN